MSSLMEHLGSVKEQLRRVLADVRNPRYRERLQQIRTSHQALDTDAFRALFEHDTTWGLFGQRHQHYHEGLGVTALTHFVPHERETQCDADDVTLLLTPIHRVLWTLTALTLKEARFESFAKCALEAMLPHRPRHGVEVGRYGSLLDVACSIWLEVCHAYVTVNEPWTIRELYCFNVDQSRAHSLWLDYDPRTFAARVKHTTLAGSSLPNDDDSGPLCLVLSPDEAPADMGSREQGGPIVCLQVLISEPWVELVWVHDDCVLFLLLTTSGGTYVSFHRAIRGRVRRYPLYIHAAGSNGNGGDDDDATPPSIAKCAVCGASDKPLAPNDMDPELNNVYCGRTCITQMEHIREVKAKLDEQRRRETELRLRLPPNAGLK